MSTGVVYLCPGQGAQAVGMGKAWYDASAAARGVFDEADSLLGGALGAPLTALCFDGPADRLSRTDVCQPALYVCGIACARALQERGDPPVLRGAAGLSLGEYTALHLAGAFDFALGLQLVRLRGAVMQAAAETSAGGMVALIGASPEDAERICADAAGDDVLVCANFNAPGQIVLSGHEAACGRAVEAATTAGFRATALTVAGAFHSPLMQPAADAMADALAEASLSAPRVPVWSNVTARPHDSEDVELLKRLLVQQITSPVRWSETCERLVFEGETAYHEVAPGAVLRGLMRRIDRTRKVVTHDQPNDATIS